MTADENKELIRKHYRSGLSGDESAIELEIAPGFVDHDAPPGTPRGPAGVKGWLRMLRNAFPDLTIDCEDILSEGDRVAVRGRWRGTHQGPFLGAAPSGNKVDFTGMVFWRIDENGQIAERWAVMDRATLGRQIGASPAGGR